MLQHRFLSLSIQTACALTACAGLVVLCYWHIDRPVALWVRDHVGVAVNWLRWPDIITAIMIAAPILLVWAGITRIRRPWRRYETLLVTIAISVVGMIILKQILKFIFGCQARDYRSKMAVHSKHAILPSDGFTASTRTIHFHQAIWPLHARSPRLDGSFCQSGDGLPLHL